MVDLTCPGEAGTVVENPPLSGKKKRGEGDMFFPSPSRVDRTPSGTNE